MGGFMEELESEVGAFIRGLSTRGMVLFKSEASPKQLSNLIVNALRPFAKWASFQEYEVRFTCENVPIGGECVSIERLHKGYIDILAEQFGSMPMFKDRIINVTVKPLEG